MADPREEIVRRLVECWNRRDLDGVLALCRPDAEYVNAPSALEPGTRRGHEGVALVMRKQWEAFEPDGRQEVTAVHEVSDGRLVTEGRVSRAMPGSDTRIENRIAVRWSFRDGLLARIEILGAGSAFQEALAAALAEG